MVDGIFSKKISLTNKPCNRSVIEIAKARVQDFGSKSQNPIVINMEKTTKEIQGLGSLGQNSKIVIANRKLPSQDSRHVNATTNKVGNLVIEFQKKASDVINDVKRVLSKAQVVIVLTFDL